MDKNLEYCRASFEKSYYHHYLISLLMGGKHQSALWTLGAFKSVLDSIPASVTNPALGYMRLTWWRDQIAMLEKGAVTKGQPILGALSVIAGGNPEFFKHLTDMINDYEPSIENSETETVSPSYQILIEKILGNDVVKYRKLENAATAILKKHHGTKWESNPPLIALRLWFAQFLSSP